MIPFFGKVIQFFSLWQKVLEDSRLIRSLLNKVILIATDGLTKEWSLPLCSYGNEDVPTFGDLALRFLFKAVFIRAYGGEFNHDSLPVPIFLDTLMVSLRVSFSNPFFSSNPRFESGSMKEIQEAWANTHFITSNSQLRK